MHYEKKIRGDNSVRKRDRKKPLYMELLTFKKMCMSKKNLNFWMRKKKDMNKFWHFTAWSLIPGVISGEWRGRGWRKAREREETERGNRSGRLSIEEKRVILRVWPGGMLNNGWLRRRVGRRGEERRGGRCHHLLLSFWFSSSQHTFLFYFIFYFSEPLLLCQLALH